MTPLADACGASPSWLCQTLIGRGVSGDLARTIDLIVTRPLRVLMILVLARVLVWFLHRVAGRWLGRMVGRSVEMLGADSRAAQRAKTIEIVLASITSIVVYSLAVLSVLQELGLNLAPFLAGAGLVGVAVGFGAQSLVRDFLSGIFMLIEDQYGVGDIVDLGDAVGTVEAVTLRTTRVRAVDGTVWHVPNGEIRRVGNRSQQWARALLDLEVPVDTDLSLASEVLARAASAVHQQPDIAADVLDQPELWGVERLSPTTATLRVVVKTRPAAQYRVLRAIRQQVAADFAAAGIPLALPTPVLPTAPGS